MSKCTLYCGDLQQVVGNEQLTADCVFVDPPDNLGLRYPGFVDKMTDEEYEQFIYNILLTATGVAPIVWISFYAQYAAMVGSLIHQYFERWEFKPCVQVYTFGQHNQNDFGRNHRPLWRLNLPGATFYPDAIRVESWRQRNGDKRADPRGRVPGDVLDFQYPGLGDVLDFPRVTGNSKQRCDWFPTQLHEEMIERILKFSTRPGQHVLDLCAGTGTVGRVCKKIDRDCSMIEVSPEHVQLIKQSLPVGTVFELSHPHGKFPRMSW